MRRFTFVFLASVVMLCAVAANAEHTRFWEQSSFDDFDKGTKKGVALRSDGNLMPAPEFKPFADPDLAYIWALAVDSKGRLYAAGGSDAKVLRLATGEKPVTVFQSAELEAQAMAVDKQDNLYVATSPDGKVYKVNPDGQHTVFFEPKTKYIWALAFNRAGTLFVATGDKGQVFAVAPDGKGQVFYKCDETHARTLAFDAHGDLLIGTDPSGLVIRVPVISEGSAMPKAGKAFVIYETDKKEVTALATDREGNIYAAAIGAKTARPSRPTIQNNAAAQQFAAALAAAAAQRGQQQQANPNGAAAGVMAAPMVFPQFPSASGGAEVYRIAADGSPESLWSSPQDVVYTLGFSAENHLLLGTGNHGDVIELGNDRLFSSLASADASQVTALIAGPGHVVYAATANPGKVFALEPTYAAEGSFESDPFDAKIYSRWGRLSWWGENGGDNKIEFYVRSGNTSDPDDYWSSWSGPYMNGSGSNVNCPPARFVQWKAVFHISGQQNLPTLSWVKLAYLRKNVAPVLDGIAVQDPGLRAQGFEGGQEGQRPPSVVPLHPPKNPQQVQQAFAAFGEAPGHPIRFTGLPQGMRAKGYQTVVWNAHDDNDDELTFSIYYRGQAEKEWKLLRKDLSENFYSWDTTSMPDGAYYLKIVASDARSNPEGQALTSEMISDRFEVDNTPPQIENVRASQSAGEWHVNFTAHDSGSAIDRTSYSMDAGKWQMLFPVGQLTDAPSEAYDIALRGLAPGEHTVAVRVFDQFENTATAKVTFTVPAH